MKVCSKCHVAKALEDYSPKPSWGPGKFCSQCKECVAAAAAANRARNGKTYNENRNKKRAENRDAVNAEKREKYRVDPGRARADCGKYYSANREKRSQQFKAWRAANADRLRAYSVSPQVRAKTGARKASKMQATPSWADLEAIRAVYDRCDEVTKATGIPHHVDHVIPLKSKWVCGLHVHTNLQVLTAEDNIRKNNRFSPGDPPCPTR